MKTGPPEIKNIWRLNSVPISPSAISAEGVVTKKFAKYLENTDLTKNILRFGQKAILLQTFHAARKFLAHARSPWDEFPLPLTEPNSTDSLGKVKVSRQINAEKCEKTTIVITKKEAEKILKYKDLITENQRMWNVKAKVILVIMRATGTISSLRQCLSNIPGKHEIKEMQKTAILGTAHMLRKLLTYKYSTYFTGEITLHVAQTVNTEQL